MSDSAATSKKEKTPFEIVLNSSVAAAIVTVVFGTFGANYVLQAVQRSAAEQAKRSDQRAAVIAGQLEAISDFYSITADYKYMSEFVLYDVTERRTLPGKCHETYDPAAKTFIAESDKMLLQLKVLFGLGPLIDTIQSQRDALRQIDGRLGKLITDIEGAKGAITDNHVTQATEIRTRLRKAYSDIDKAVVALASESAARK